MLDDEGRWGGGYGMGPGPMGQRGMKYGGRGYHHHGMMGGGGHGMMGGGPGMFGGGGPGMMRGGGGPGMWGGGGPGMWGGGGPGMWGGGGPGMTGGGGPGMMGGPGMAGPGRMLAGLDLTEDQLAQVQKVHDDLRRRNWGVRGALMEERVKLRDLYAAPSFDSAAISAVYKRIGELRQQMLEGRLAAHAATEKILTAEQREALRSRWRQMGRRMGGWQGN